MKKIKIEKTLTVAALSLGLTACAFAQSMQSPSTQSPPAASQYGTAPYTGGAGLVGTTYSELSFGYEKESAVPRVLHDYELVYNESVVRDSTFGIDGNFTYDYLTGGAYGYHDYRQEALLGATGYMNEGWGKIFVTGDGGIALQQAADITTDAFAYSFTGGVELPVVGNLVLTPFVEYEAIPRLRDHHPNIASLPNYTWEYGVKATYRINREWNVSLTAELDEHSISDVGFRAGFSYRY